MSSNDQGDGVFCAPAFVLKDSGYADLVVGEDFSDVREDARLVLCHEADVEPAGDVLDFFDERFDFGPWF